MGLPLVPLFGWAYVVGATGQRLVARGAITGSSRSGVGVYVIQHEQLSPTECQYWVEPLGVVPGNAPGFMHRVEPSADFRSSTVRLFAFTGDGFGPIDATFQFMMARTRTRDGQAA